MRRVVSRLAFVLLSAAFLVFVVAAAIVVFIYMRCRSCCGYLLLLLFVFVDGVDAPAASVPSDVVVVGGGGVAGVVGVVAAAATAVVVFLLLVCVFIVMSLLSLLSSFSLLLSLLLVVSIELHATHPEAQSGTGPCPRPILFCSAAEKYGEPCRLSRHGLLERHQNERLLCCGWKRLEAKSNECESLDV